jgi:hypothetical protein
MQDEAERALMQPQDGEVHDISLGTLRFISALFAAGLVLMIAVIF